MGNMRKAYKDVCVHHKKGSEKGTVIMILKCKTSAQRTMKAIIAT